MIVSRIGEGHEHGGFSGYGQFGPAKNKPSYDVSGQAMGGYMYMNDVAPARHNTRSAH